MSSVPSSESLSLATRFRYFLELIRFSHTIFALPFALLAGVWASLVSWREDGRSGLTWWMVVAALVCMVAARSFAMAVNRLADQRWDGLNPRTANRHLPAGKLTRTSVLGFAAGCGLVFVLATVLFLPNRLPLILALPVLVFLGGYSYAKRFTAMAHYWLGVALMLAPICVWIALRGEAVMADPGDLGPAIMLGAVVFFWVGGFDLIYACQDADFDRENNLQSLPAKLGVKNALRISAASHILMLVPAALLPILFPQLGLGTIYWIGLGVVAILLAYQHSIVSENDLGRVNQAFFQLNAIISLILLVCGMIDALY